MFPRVTPVRHKIKHLHEHRSPNVLRRTRLLHGGRSSSHDRHFLAALSNRVLELTPEGPHQYGGGYSEYVARTGQEAPGLRS